ncbi:hypothetical protein FOA52_010946 [Chlamydomonas sp. UWO 241]|nr:hypothetical protein FOA52_010946 [Chlamydomonas sp. UWO 241]
MAGDSAAGKDQKDVGKKEEGKKKPEEKEEELSEEDAELKRNLETMIERVMESDVGVQQLALDSMINEIRSATASMTSVPKPLKFLNTHLDALVARCEVLPAGSPNQSKLADIVSVLATTVAPKEGVRNALKFRLLGSSNDIGVWGHEYLRHLAGEISHEFNERDDAGAPCADLLALVAQIVPYHMTHNAEPEAVDLLLEVDRLDDLVPLVDDKNYARTCLYLTSCCTYLPEPDDQRVLEVSHAIYMKMGKMHDALRVSLRLNRRELVESTFAACADPLEKKQLCYLLARQGYALKLDEGVAAIADETLQESCREIISNSKLSEHFLALGRDLDVMEPKQPDDVYKTHLIDGRAPTGAAVDSARQNLASTFVNAFVNAGFGTDKLVTVEAEASSSGAAASTHWIFKNRDHGKTSATASVGMITMWDVEGGLPQNENDPAFALISDYVSNPDPSIRIGAVLGLGLAYAGTNREEVEELLLPLVTETDVSMELAGFAALALGLVFTSTCKEDIVMGILQALMCRSEADLASPFAKYLCLGLGFLFLGKQDVVEATLEVAKTLNETISQFCQVTLESLAYAGTGDVLKVQQLLAMCGEHIEAEEGKEWKAMHQGPAVIGLALIAMAEPCGAQMAGRSLEHMLQYGEPSVRRAVPLAIAVLNISSPDMNAIDTLARLSHDTDSEVAQNSVLALGLCGAGTNNARLAGILRNLSSYYYKDPVLLYLVKVSQGLVHMGKGLMTLSPYHTERQLLSGVALAGVLSVVFSALDMKATLTGKHAYVLYALSAAMAPRMLMTLDEEGKLLPVVARIGNAVDTVAQAGRPKTITGFQTHTTPVLMGMGERAELGTEKYIALSPVLEGQVILKLNPDYVETNTD